MRPAGGRLVKSVWYIGVSCGETEKKITVFVFLNPELNLNPSLSGAESQLTHVHRRGGPSVVSVIVHGPGIETLQYVSFQYLLVCKMNYSAFRDYLRWYIAA